MIPIKIYYFFLIEGTPNKAITPRPPLLPIIRSANLYIIPLLLIAVTAFQLLFILSFLFQGKTADRATVVRKTLTELLGGSVG